MDPDAQPLLDLVATAAPGYLDSLAGRLVDDPAARGLLDDLDGPLPEEGLGAPDSVGELLRIGTGAATHSAGPRFFHLVVGGVTPAALAGDWVTSLLDQNAVMRTSSALATRAES